MACRRNRASFHHGIGHGTHMIGFSLLELLIVIVIIGVLSAIAIPTYTRHIVQSHRHAAAACLLQYSHYMERHYAVHLSYTLETDLPLLGCAHATQDTYRYRLDTMADNHYVLEAAPISIQARRDGACGTLTLTASGARDASGNRAQCW